MYKAEVLGRYEKQAIFTPSQIGLGMFILDSGAAQATVGFFYSLLLLLSDEKINLNSGNHRKIGCPGVLGSCEALRKLQGGVACVMQCASLGVSCIPEKSFLSTSCPWTTCPSIALTALQRNSSLAGCPNCICKKSTDNLNNLRSSGSESRAWP